MSGLRSSGTIASISSFSVGGGKVMSNFEEPEYPPLLPDPVIEAYKRDIDLTLIRENLKLTPEERLKKLMDLQKFAAELQRAGRAARRQPILDADR